MSRCSVSTCLLCYSTVLLLRCSRRMCSLQLVTIGLYKCVRVALASFVTVGIKIINILSKATLLSLIFVPFCLDYDGLGWRYINLLSSHPVKNWSQYPMLVIQLIKKDKAPCLCILHGQQRVNREAAMVLL